MLENVNLNAGGVSFVAQWCSRMRNSYRSSVFLGAALIALSISNANAAQGVSLYPKDANGVENSDIGRALGSAKFFVANPGQDEDFVRLVQMAVGQHPAFHAQTSQRERARADIRAARASLYPQLSASLAGDYVISRDFRTGTENVVESLKPEGQVNGVLSASQLIFDGGATFARIKSAKARSRETEQTMISQTNQITLSALSAYHDVATHQAILALGEEFVQRHEKLLADVKERERLGGGSMADVMRASARLASARARVSEIQESARRAEIRYFEYFREEPGRLTAPSFEALSVGSRDEAVAIAMQRNPDVAAAMARVDSAQADFKAAKAARLPELRASATAVKYDLIDGGDDHDVRAGVDLNYNLFSGGTRGAAIARARADASANKFDEARIKQEVARDAAIAFERQSATQSRLAALEDALVSQYKARDLVSARFRAARGDLLDLLQAENDWFDSGVAYLAGAADRDMAIYEMMEFTGDLQRFFSPANVNASFVDGVDLANE